MARGKIPKHQSEAANLTSPSCTPPSSPRSHHDHQNSKDPHDVSSPAQDCALITTSVTGFPVATALIPGLKEYTWEEVAEHKTGQSCWCYIGQKVYDITEWLDRHPGGRHVLLLAAGRDCTDLFTSYHPFTDKPAKLLTKFCIGQVVTTEFPQYQPDTGFYAELRKEVGQFFLRNKLDSKDPKAGLIRLMGMLMTAALSFSLLIYDKGSLPWYVRLISAVVFGLCQALSLLHAMHDASHMAIGPSATWWQWIGKFCMDWFAGASMDSWHNQHILGHHVYTNVMGVDPDLPIKKTGDIRRICWQQKWLPLYRFQHVYLCVLYGLLTIKYRLQDLTNTVLDKCSGNVRVNDLGWTETLSQLLSKSFWFCWRFYLPIIYFQLDIASFLALSLLAEFTTGYYLTFNFQVSHVSPLAEFPDGERNSFKLEWAQSQVVTTVDYGYHSSLTAFLTGALNYQSVHHLFPSVSQYHYPAIAQIVHLVAGKHNLKINYVKTFREAFKLHIQHLQNLGFADELFHHY
jgi:fatty acid desaturase/cytochrome b involved in lipid metabolism